MSFDEFSPEAPDQVPAEKRAHARAGERKSGVSLESHVCRSCFGRVASEIHCKETGERRFFCTNCGLEAIGHKPSAVCSCGLKVRKARGDGRSSTVLVDAGLRCHPNRRRSPEFPSLYTASFGGAQGGE